MKLVEMFQSWQGEGRWTGYPMAFIRITGCPVNCPFCDTDYRKGTKYTLDEILEFCTKNNHVCVTGGEPLAHPRITSLLEGLTTVNPDSTIHIETSGCYRMPDIIFRERQRFWLTVSPKGAWLGAEKECIKGVVWEADECKWIVPSTPGHIIEALHNPDRLNYLQPENDKYSIRFESLQLAQAMSWNQGWPLSVQLHKILDWR